MSTTATAVLKRTQLSTAERSSYHQQGYVILRDMIRAEILAAWRNETLAVIASRNMPDSFLAQTSEYLAGSVIDQVVNGPELAAVAQQVLKDEPQLYLPFSAVKGPHQGAFGFHQDNNYTYHDGASCNAWCALVPMTVANGCLRVVPGSNKGGTLAAVASEHAGHREVASEPATWDDIVMNAGDICLFDRLTVHGSGPNTTDAPRIGYAVQYTGANTRWRDPDTGTMHRHADRTRFSVGPVNALSTTAQLGE
ncbi:MAG: phytanoyl-CoA dioxygenase family protein [Planctomycetota bacterium]|jgi:ectoine hydroxylase-related dioxygenase (phytanoyl-CoA dioxygenase family)|nr:phytanoyl-CoA dioxygenase family protein [Planctomycetota bacterium]